MSEFGKDIQEESEYRMKILDVVSNYNDYLKLKSEDKWNTIENSLILRLFLKKFEVSETFKDKDDYVNELLKLHDLERYIESLKVRSYFNAKFHFDPREQRHITKRLIIELHGQRNIREKSVLDIRIPYKLTPEQEERALKLEEAGGIRV